MIHYNGTQHRSWHENLPFLWYYFDHVWKSKLEHSLRCLLLFIATGYSWLHHDNEHLWRKLLITDPSFTHYSSSTKWYYLWRYFISKGHQCPTNFLISGFYYFWLESQTQSRSHGRIFPVLLLYIFKYCVLFVPTGTIKPFTSDSFQTVLMDSLMCYNYFITFFNVTSDKLFKYILRSNKLINKYEENNQHFSVGNICELSSIKYRIMNTFYIFFNRNAKYQILKFLNIDLILRIKYVLDVNHHLKLNFIFEKCVYDCIHILWKFSFTQQSLC